MTKKKFEFIIDLPNLSNELETKCFKVSLSASPAKIFDSFDDKDKQIIKDLVKKHSFENYYDDFYKGVGEIAHLSVLRTIIAYVCKNYNDYIEDIVSDCYSAALELITPDENGKTKYSPEDGPFRAYSKRMIIGTAADSYMKYKSPLSFTTATLRMAKKTREDISRFYNGEIPDVDQVVEEFYRIPRTSSRFEGKVRSLQYFLSIYDNPVSIYKKSLERRRRRAERPFGIRRKDSG